MAFWKSDDKKKEEIEEVKRQVESRSNEPDTRLPEPPKPPIPEEEAPDQDPGISETRIDRELEEPSIRMREEEPEPELRREESSQRRRREELPEVTRRPPARGSEEGEFAPLFVKIDKYEEILQDLEIVRGSLEDLKMLIELMNELDQVKRSGMSELTRGISGLADTLVNMDSKFIRPEGTEEAVREPESEVGRNVRELEESLRSIRDELERLE